MFQRCSKQVPNVFQKCSKRVPNVFQIPRDSIPFNLIQAYSIPYRTARVPNPVPPHTIFRKIHALVVTYKFHPCRNYLLNLRQNQNNPNPPHEPTNTGNPPSSPEHQIIINTQRLNITNPPAMFTASMRQTSPTASRTTLQRCQKPTHTFPVYKSTIQRQSSPQTSP